MPSQTYPQAQFVPLSPDMDLSALVESSDNFDYVTRLSTEKLKEHSIQSFEALILAVVVKSGKPLVIENWGEALPPWLFSKGWLESNFGTKPEQVRDIPNEVNIPMTIGHYLRSMDQLTKQFTKDNYRDPKRQRLYLKDIDCPDAWAEHLKSVIPECIYYLNECIESRTGGDGAILEPNEYGQMRYGKGVAPAGDLMSSLPPEMRALNMMCYIGHEGTYTATHREMCATLGHNIMVNASRDGPNEIEGSSLWFMTETKEREVVSEYFLSMLGHDIEVEKHFAQVNAWKKAPFNVWVVEQKVGDLILIPPLAPHQVWNRGTQTMKVAWNRTTVDTLELALHEALPRGRMVCRDEQYKCKAIVYYTLVKYYELLQRDTIEPKMWEYGRIKQLLEDFRRLFSLYQEILVSEMFSPKSPEEKDIEMVPFDSNVTCSYCRLNIFNRFLTCKSCILYGENGEEDNYDICMDCYAMGRSCACISALTWVEQWDWQVLVKNYELWRAVVVQFDGFFDIMRSPQALDVARKRYGRKPIAEVCQEQLRRRPWTDITKTKELTPEMSDVEPEVDDEGHTKGRKGGKKNATRRNNRLTLIKGKTHACHICFHREWNWKLAFCTSCTSAYCYGVLWRAFDLMPQTVMEDKDWQCPKCLKICSCAKCRKGKVQDPYQPKGTLLGHDTRKVADYRSVESLVDFSKTNLSWLRDNNAGNPQESDRMKKLKEKAEADKARVDSVDQGYAANSADRDPFAGTPADADADTAANTALHDHARDMQDIDPSLRGPGLAASISIGNGGSYSEDHDDPATFTRSDHGVFTLSENMDDDIQNDWMDGLYNFDGYNPAIAQSASYPARLLAPVVPMGTSASTPAPTPGERSETTVSDEHAAPSYPDPSNVAQNRMMGIGYYQQGDGVDRILYDPPNTYESFEQPPQPTLVQSPNMALSDLLDPARKSSEAKKRKRLGDDEDVQDELFTTKRQKMRAITRKHKSYSENVSSEISRSEPEKRRPHRNTAKPRSYTDLGEDAVPIEEDEANLVPAYSYERRPKGDNLRDDLELTAQKIGNLSKPEVKRGRPKAAPRTNTIKTPRKSAWLTRKQADVSEAEVSSSALAKQTRRRRTKEANEVSRSKSKAIEILSGASLDSDAGGVEVNYSHIERDKGSLFVEPLESNNGTEEATLNGSKVVRMIGNEQGSDLQLSSEGPVPEDEFDFENRDKPAPNRRGRPRQQIDKSDIDNQEKSALKRGGRPRKQLALATELKSPSAAPKMLSLKEKLALKGRSFKIVGKSKASHGTLSRPPNVQSTPATTPKSILKRPSIVISMPSKSMDKKPYLAQASSESSPVMSPADMPISQTASISNFGTPHGADTSDHKETSISRPGLSQSAVPAPPQRKGLTVVRLVSPD